MEAPRDGHFQSNYCNDTTLEAYTQSRSKPTAQSSLSFYLNKINSQQHNSHMYMELASDAQFYLWQVSHVRLTFFLLLPNFLNGHMGADS